MSISEVLKRIHRSAFDELNHCAGSEPKILTRDEHFSHRDAYQIQKKVLNEIVRLNPDDGKSLVKWVANLWEEGCFVFLKTCLDIIPPGSGLDPFSFILIIQTRYQRDCWRKYGTNRFAAIDGTHCTNQYENMNLFMLLVRDDWGHGMPVAWMLPSNGTQATLEFYLKQIRVENPTMIPKEFMSDKDHAQMNTIEVVYPECDLFLCWWHVLHAWQAHFTLMHFPILWDLLKKLIHAPTVAEFDDLWQTILDLPAEDCPPSMIEYLEMNWIWHHVLKVRCAIPYFIQRHHRQDAGFDGLSLEVKERKSIEEHAQSIKKSDITKCFVDLELSPDAKQFFFVASQSDPTMHYTVDVSSYHCNCKSFPHINYCKHICAVQNHFPEALLRSQSPSLLLRSSDSDTTNAINSAITFSQNTSIEPSQPALEQEFAGQVASQLQNLAEYLKSNGSSQVMENLCVLSQQVYDFAETSEITTPTSSLSIIPSKKAKIASNQHSWTEMAAVMGVPVKGKRKKKYDEPYAGGERSGKKAKPDAREKLFVLITNTQPEPASAQKHQVSLPSTQQRNLTWVSVMESCKEGEITASIDPALFPPTTTLESSTCSAEGLSDDFQVKNFNIHDLDALMDLSHARLSALCQHYGNLCHLNEFHPVLVKAADTGNSYLPLHLFTSSNLMIIQSHGFSLPDKKIYLPSGSSVRILDVDNSIFGKESEMTELGGDIWAERWESHFGFFYDIVNLSLVFQAVLRACTDLRKDYHAQLLASGSGFAFTEEYYTVALKKTKEDIRDEREARDKEREASWASKLLAPGPSVASVPRYSEKEAVFFKKATQLSPSLMYASSVLGGDTRSQTAPFTTLILASQPNANHATTNQIQLLSSRPQESVSASPTTSWWIAWPDAATSLPMLRLQPSTNAHGALQEITMPSPGAAERTLSRDPSDI
ncbi:uncharacterized protein ARMOST_12681 [Armillaria ostoyae]|uniref:SWIM-type domain-containing protein n=1 Tax=Armillaria ostoyae TaxID=47428 RepID=A0A284RKN5_ARMOS|nr:uncharacterized protein ARMOST_12681 [Armillaria ostoyae]